MGRLYSTSHGPFTAAQLRTGDPYELSDGHAIRCSPAGGRHSGANADGASVIGSDPDVEAVGVDAGFSPEPGTLRAPDVAVGVSDDPGWSPGAPPLALEYADRGQDEDDLAEKIRDLLAAGTRWVWVVRLDGPRRVEIHSPDAPVRQAHPGDVLEAPGVLRNPVPVEALFDKQAARRVTLRNLLQREGYADLDAVLHEGELRGRLADRKASLLELCDAKGFELSPEQRQRIRSCDDLDRLKAWFSAAAVAESADGLLDPSVP